MTSPSLSQAVPLDLDEIERQVKADAHLRYTFGIKPAVVLALVERVRSLESKVRLLLGPGRPLPPHGSGP